jgi:DNA-binding protein YbaB
MFGNMLGDMESRQKEMKEKLSLIKLKADAGDGAITIECNAGGVIENIILDESKIDLKDKEQMEDLLLIAMNRAMQLIRQTEATEGQKLIKDMLPPGMDNLFG